MYEKSSIFFSWKECVTPYFLVLVTRTRRTLWDEGSTKIYWKIFHNHITHTNTLHKYSHIFVDPTRIGGVVCVEPNVNMSVFIKVFVIVDRRIRIYQVIYVSIINFDILVILDFLYIFWVETTIILFTSLELI